MLPRSYEPQSHEILLRQDTLFFIKALLLVLGFVINTSYQHYDNTKSNLQSSSNIL